MKWMSTAIIVDNREFDYCTEREDVWVAVDAVDFRVVHKGGGRGEGGVESGDFLRDVGNVVE